MSTQRLLQVLAQQIAALAAEVTPRGDVPIPQARFDAALFANRGTRLRDYLAEVEKNFAQLQSAANDSRTSQVAFLAENWWLRSLPCSASWQPRRCGARTSRKKPRGRSVPQAGRASGLRTPADRHDSGSGKPAGAPDHAGGAAKAAARAGGAGGRLMRCRQALARIERNIERKENGFEDLSQYFNDYSRLRAGFTILCRYASYSSH